MDDEKEDSGVSSNTAAVSLSENTTDSSSVASCEDVSRRQSVLEQNTNCGIVNNYYNISNCQNVEIGNEIGNRSKTDGRSSNIKESTKSMLNSVDWRVYVETRAEERGVAVLKQYGVVIVVGCPGSGKTTLALSMMRKIEKEEKRESFLLTHEYEFNDISLSRNKKCVVLIDDIFGKTNLISDFMSSWRQRFPVVQSLVWKGSLKCIITLRNQIFAKSETGLKKFELFNETHLLDLQSDDCCLLHDEKKKILNKYLKQKDVPMDEEDKHKVIVSSCTELGFPQVCVYYVNSSDAQKRGVEFFKKPVEYLRQELENMKSDESLQINYLVLLLIMFQQGNLSIDSLDPFENDSDSETMKLVKLLERVCPSLKNTDLTLIKKTADEMCGTYLKCYDNIYTFIHQSVFDCLFLIFSSEFPKKAAELLEVCPVSMLLEYVVTPGVSNKSHITMTVRPDCFDVLARRFTDLLASSRAREIISHPSLKDEEFVKYIIEKKDFYGKLSDILNQKLHRITHFYPCEIDTNFFDSHLEPQILSSPYVRVKEAKESYSSSVASECVVNGLRTLSKYFASNLCKMELTDHKKELLDISCLFGDEDVVKILLQSGVNPSTDTFCVAACSESDNVAILEELLQYEKEVKFNKYSQLLFLSIYSCNMNIACYLADIINAEKDKSEIKEKALKLLLFRFHRNVSGMVYIIKSPVNKVVDISHLLKKLVTIEIINKIKNIAVIAAGQRGSDVIKEIVKVKPDCLNDENRDEVLLAAAIWGSADTVNFLIDQRQNDTDENNWKKSQVLKVAVMFNNADVVQCLLDKGAHPNAHVAVNRKLIQWFNYVNKNCTFDTFLWSTRTRLHLLPCDSPLHISVLRGELALLKLLVKRNADINSVNSKGETPLHEGVIVNEHRLELTLFLLDNGADVNITDENKNSALHLAAEHGHVDVVTVLIEKGADLNLTNNDNHSALHKAAKHGKIEIVRELVEKGVDINIKNSKCETPLLTAVNYIYEEVVWYLLEHGADPNLTDCNNNSVLHIAAKLGSIEIVKALIEKGVDVNIKNNKDKTPLLTSVNCRNDEVVLYLLEHGADPHLTYSDNNSVLHIAAELGSIEIVKALIGKGVDVNIKNNKGKTPLLTSVNYRNDEVVLYLLEHGAYPNLADSDNNSVLHIAAKLGSIEIVKALIGKGVDVNIKNNEGKTPLLTSVNYRNDEVVLYLLEHGAYPNLADSDNNSVLHLAAECGNIEIVTALIEKGVDVNMKNSRSETPLLTASYCDKPPCYLSFDYDHCNIVLYLLEHGADPNLADSDNNSVLHIAAKNARIEIVEALIGKGVDVNIKNKEGKTPLLIAVNYIYEEVVWYLLEHGADPNLTDCNNNSVLHIAAKLGSIDIVKALIGKGVDVNIKNYAGETPLLTAVNYRNDEVVSYLQELGDDPCLTER